MNSKKKVIHLIPNTGFGGTSKMLLNIYKEIDKTKISFDFISFNKGDLHKEFEKFGGKVFYIPYIKRDGLLKHMRTIRSILIENGPYDSFHAHNGYKSGPALLVAKQCGIEQRIAHIHQNEVNVFWQKPILPFLKRIINKNSTLNFACSVSAGNLLFKNDDFTVINNSIELNDYRKLDLRDPSFLKTEFNLEPNQDLILGHVGRFSAVKNHDFLIDICKELQANNFNFKLLLIGEGPLRAEIEKKVKGLKLADDVIFTGTRTDVPKILSNIDLFLLPSHFEGFSIALLEAQASSINSIASNTIPEEVDLGLGLLKYKDLKDGSASWANSIMHFTKKEPSELCIHNKISERGLDIESSIRKITNLYLNHNS